MFYVGPTPQFNLIQILMLSGGRQLRVMLRVLVQGPDHARQGNPIYSRVMNLQHQSRAACREPFNIVESVDKKGMPQGFFQVQATAMQARQHSLKLLPVTGLWQRVFTDMLIEIKFFVSNPVGLIHSHG